MPTVTDNAICIRRWDYSETSQTVSLFLRSHGIVRGLVKGAKRARGGFEGGIDVLTHGQVVAIIRPAADLATVTAWRVLEVFRALREHLAANRAGLYMADLIHHMLTEHDPHPRLFDALRSALGGLDDIDRIPETLLRFEWTVLRESGYRPQLDRDAQTGAALPADTPTLAFSAAAGGVVADTGAADRWRVRRETIDLLRAVAADEPTAEAAPARLEGAARLLAVYIRALLGAEPKSMRWAFPDLQS
jgi:DNA repair protein RecO (recombination protein O)